MLTLTGIEEVKAHVGKELGVSDWHEVTQDEVNRFAEVTGDDQWIHLDVERAKETPFGGTIAHGYFTLSLAPMFSYRMFSIDGFAFGVNYGLNKVRQLSQRLARRWAPATRRGRPMSSGAAFSPRREIGAALSALAQHSRFAL